MKKPLYGIGISDANYVVCQTIDGKKKICPFYQVWHSMLQRCYSSKLQVRRPTYLGCTVVEEWHSFMAFRAWMIRQDWQGKQLDKDILVAGNKIYSPSACIFVSRSINNLLNDHGSARGEWPIGVFYRIQNKKFQAYCHLNGKQKYLGLFLDPHLAHRAWQHFKIKVIQQAAADSKSACLVAALNRISDKIQSDIDKGIETMDYV